MLYDHGPLSVGVAAYNDGFMNAGPNSPIDCSAANESRLDHAVLLVGYDENNWIIKNSWNVWWGNNGYGYLPKNLDCGMHQEVYVVEVASDELVSQSLVV